MLRIYGIRPWEMDRFTDVEVMEIKAESDQLGR